MTNLDDTQLRELGQRLTECEHFRWAPGMVDAFDGAMVTSVADNGTISEVIYEGELMSARPASVWGDDDGDWYDSTGAAPDLRDPGTLGHVLQLVREAWSSTSAWVMPNDAAALRVGLDCKWKVRGLGAGVLVHDLFDSEAAALVAALEAAPPR